MIEGCPYCQKVISKLDSLDIEYQTIQVPREKSQRDEVVEISGQSSVPVITDENNDVQGMNESSDIIEYLDEEYNDEDSEQSDS
jgi:glutathione S-transferase